MAEAWRTPGQVMGLAFMLGACGGSSPTESLETCEAQNNCEELEGPGEETVLRCRPSVLDFGSVDVGQRTEGVVNCQAMDSVVRGVRAFLAPDGSPDFAYMAPAEPADLGPSEAQEFLVAYRPETLGEDLGRLIVDFEGPEGQSSRREIDLRGSGGGPNIVVAPTRLNFPLTGVGASSKRPLLLTNLGFEDLEVAVEVQGEVFSIPEDGAFVVPPGESEVLDLMFTPPREGALEGRLVIRSNDRENAVVDVHLQGLGVQTPPCDYELSTSGLNFGVVPTGAPSVRRLIIRNTSTAMRCLLSELRLTPESDVAFELPEGELREVFIEADASLEVPVELFSALPGSFVGELQLTLASPDQPLATINLAGAAADNVLAFEPSQVNFGAIKVGCEARARRVRVRNESPVSAEDVSFALDSQPGVFSFRNLPPSPPSIASGEDSFFDVGFAAPGPNPTSYAGAVELTASFEGQEAVFLLFLSGSGFLGPPQVQIFEARFYTRYFLSQQPVIQSIRVFVDEEPVPDTEPSGAVNWTYDFSTNSVNFLPLAMPEPGSEVRIEYVGECL